MKHKLLPLLLLLLAASIFLYWKKTQAVSEKIPPSFIVDVIPPGIIVTESSAAIPATADTSERPGDSLLRDYATPASNAKQDLAQLSRVLSNFLLIQKQATARPLSANQEWSATLRGQRPGSEAWLTPTPRLFDAQNRLIDRWQNPLHFHALGQNRWEIRSPGPDHLPHTPDDLTEPLH